MFASVLILCFCVLKQYIAHRNARTSSRTSITLISVREPMTTISERLQILRGDKSRRSFADFLGIPASTLKNYEQGDTSPPLETLELVCEKLCISRKWLMLGEGSMRAGESSAVAGQKTVELEGQERAFSAQPPVFADQTRELKIRVKELELEKEQLERHNKLLAEENKFVREVRLSRDKDVEHYQRTIDGLLQQLQALTSKGEPTISDAPVSARSAPSTSLTSDE